MGDVDERERKARFAYHLRYAREKRGMTPPQLAERLDVQRGTVNKWEDRDSTAAPSILMLGQLCRELRIDPSLFAVLPPIPPSPVDDYLLADEIERAIDAGVERALSEQPGDEDPAGKTPPAPHGRNAPNGQ